MNKLEGLERLLLSLWVGIMVGVGYIATPVLFKVLDDRKMAGGLAGEMFHVVTIIGLIFGGILFLLRYKDESIEFFKQWRGWLLMLMLVLVAISMFILQPMIVEVKALGIVEGSENAKKFGMLHGMSSLVYMVTIVSGILLIFFGLRKSQT